MKKDITMREAFEELKKDLENDKQHSSRLYKVINKIKMSKNKGGKQ
jgi:hypothetical protein